MTTVCPTRGKKKSFSLSLFSQGHMHKLPCVEDEHRRGARGDIQVGSGHGAEESVNEGTAAAERLPPASFFSQGAPSCIIFLTPLQEGLMMLSKDSGLWRKEGGGWPDIPRRTAQTPERR